MGALVALVERCWFLIQRWCWFLIQRHFVGDINVSSLAMQDCLESLA